MTQKETQADAPPLKKSEKKREKREKQDHGKEILEIIKIWEQFRRHDTDQEKRYMLIDKCLKLTKTFFHELCMARDTAHLVQSMFQFGTEKQQWEMFNLLKIHIPTLCLGRYSCHVVMKLLRTCGKSHIDKIIELISTRIEKFLTHKSGSAILEALYNEFSNAKTRKMILKKIYSSFYAFDFDNTSLCSLKDLIKLNQKNKKIILEKICEFLQKCAEKGFLQNTLTQQIFFEYLHEEIPYIENRSSEEEFQMPDRLSSLISTIVENQQLIPMLNTAQGVKIGIYLLISSPVKVRRSILKLLKTYVVGTACHEKGYLFIISALDCVDDIVLLKKTIITELLEDIDSLIVHPNGRKVLLYCLTGRNSQHLSRQLINDVLSIADYSPHTKKGLSERVLELRSVSVGLVPRLLDSIIKDLEGVYVGDRVENLDPIRDRGRQILLMEIIKRTSEKELSYEYCQEHYKRTKATTEETRKTDIIKPEEIEVILTKRKEAVKVFVERLLAVEYSPTTHSHVQEGDHEVLNKIRKRRAMAIAEEEMAKKKNIRVDAFTNMNSKKFDEEDGLEPMEVDHGKDKKEKKLIGTKLTKEEEAIMELAWIERPEANIVMKNLIVPAKTLGDVLFLDEIIAAVPNKRIQSWTQNNRTCFLLVKLVESEYAPMIKFIQKALNLKELANGSLPAQEILLNKLKKN